MARYEVTLCVEQQATVVVEIEGDLPADSKQCDALLQYGALARLDASGGAEWEATGGWLEYIALAPGEV